MMKPEANKPVFFQILGNNLVAAITNMFVWFALAFWAFLQTGSVVVTSMIAGSFAVAGLISAFPFGTFVDHTRKKTAMLVSSLVSLVMYGAGAAFYVASPAGAFDDPGSPRLWILVVILIVGNTAGTLRYIALSTTVSLLFTEGKDQANGMVGVVNGIGFSLTSVFSGLAIGFLGFGFALFSAVAITFLTIAHLAFIPLVEKRPAAFGTGPSPAKFDIGTTISTIKSIPGLPALIFFATLNNLIGGIFMALLDAYGLSLVSVQAWGIMFAVASFGTILGSIYISRKGLGPRPLRTLFLANIVIWATAIFLTVQPSVILLGIGILIWMTTSPFIEASEQTVLQTVVPFEQQGRVFGFAQSIESAATPVTAFLIGPVTQMYFIPFMTTGRGVTLIGDWFGTGADRGMALMFIFGGTIGLIITVIALRTRWYRILANKYEESAQAAQS